MLRREQCKEVLITVGHKVIGTALAAGSFWLGLYETIKPQNIYRPNVSFLSKVENAALISTHGWVKYSQAQPMGLN